MPHGFFMAMVPVSGVSWTAPFTELDTSQKQNGFVFVHKRDHKTTLLKTQNFSLKKLISEPRMLNAAPLRCCILKYESATAESKDGKLILNRAAVWKSIRIFSKEKNMLNGNRIHIYIIESGLFENDTAINNALITMYAKCGSLEKARLVFDRMLVRDKVSWTALISAYAEYGFGDEALNCFEKMRIEGYHVDPITLSCVLKACGSIGNLEKGVEIHVEAKKQGLLENNIVLGTALIHMYVKCGSVLQAQNVFEQLSVRDAVACTALISGYVDHGRFNEALIYFQKMQDEGISPNTITLTCILKACGSVGRIDKGEEIHDKIKRQHSLENNFVLGTALVDMYAKCGALDQAQDVFDSLVDKNVVSWTALIRGYAQHGLTLEALNCYQKMKNEGVTPNSVTYACVLDICGSMGLLKEGEEIHAEVTKHNLLIENVVLGTSLVNMYAKCGALEKAHHVLNELTTKNIISWTALIEGYVQHGLNREALDCFENMLKEGYPPDEFTFCCILKACGNLGSASKGEEIYNDIKKQRLLEKDFVLATALVDMYVKCDNLTRAQEVFNELPIQNVTIWNTLISGYAKHGLVEDVIICFHKMQDASFPPDEITYVAVLTACAKTGYLEKGEEIHSEVAKRGLLDSNTELGNALLNLYSKHGMLMEAQDVFDRIALRDVISWNALVTGYAQNGLHYEAVNCFGQMQEEGLNPDVITFACILKTHGILGSAKKGQEMHAGLKECMLEKNVMLGNVLIYMYANIGIHANAESVFNGLLVKDVISWNALITAYAQLGQTDMLFVAFGKMIEGDTMPDMTTFLLLLSTCSHSGLVEEGQIVFDSMTTIYYLTPALEHYTSMVDLFSRAGDFVKASFVIDNITVSDCTSSWQALLSACQKWENLEVGKVALERILQLDQNCAYAYICMSNVYAATGD